MKVDTMLMRTDPSRDSDRLPAQAFEVHGTPPRLDGADVLILAAYTKRYRSDMIADAVAAGQSATEVTKALDNLWAVAVAYRDHLARSPAPQKLSAVANWS